MQRVANGISVKTDLEDAMSKKSIVTITLPPYGASPTIEDIASALENLRSETTRTLVEAKLFVKLKLQDKKTDASKAEKFYVDALRRIGQAEDAVAEF